MWRPEATQEQEEEEERVASVPPSPTSPREDVMAPCNDDCSMESAESYLTGEPRQPTTKLPSSSCSWASVLPTRGIGLVVGGLVVLALLVGSTSSGWSYNDISAFLRGSSIGGGIGHGRHERRPARVPIPFNCIINETSPTCRRATTAPSPSRSPSPSQSLTPSSAEHPPVSPPSPACPQYFRHIHSDLSPWRASGISREAVERARPKAHFRLVVVAGRAYVETYRRAFQTRDVFTQWGVLQLLARRPGRVPDLDLMFFCDDRPQVRAAGYRGDPSAAPPLFGYCRDGGGALDILFPDWTFWGWPEVGIRPWAPFLEEAARENRAVPWPEREPYAYWRGNPDVAASRRDLLRCNASGGGGRDWNARVFRQDWGHAASNGFKDSNMAKQCLYRYKIYVEGRGWSVSKKYILACDSPMLQIDTPYEDFSSRGLVAGRHYWPIDAARKCPSIKFAVDWGNAHPKQAQRMGEEGSAFTQGDLSMDNVYDYMLHLLTSYARLLRYKPTIPQNAVEICLESMACPATGRAREFMMESMERYVGDQEPCTLPPPFTPDEMRDMAHTDQEVRSNVKKMEEQQEA